MAALTDLITQSLAPGIALTSVIFYNTSLQNRFVYITGRIRELNREARGLRDDPTAAERLASIRWQVDLMSRRSLVVRRTVLTVYGGFLCFISTILLLLLLAVVPAPALLHLPTIVFAAGFVMLVAAAAQSSVEMYLSHRTIVEDIRSSLPPRGPEGAARG